MSAVMESLKTNLHGLRGSANDAEVLDLKLLER